MTDRRIVAVGVDPGLRQCGVAFCDVQTSALLRAWLVKSPELKDDGVIAWEAMARQVVAEVDERLSELAPCRLEVLAVERMAIRGDQERGLITKNPGTMLTLQAIGAMVLALLPATSKACMYPQQWNGSAKKALTTVTVWRGLSVVERTVVEVSQREISTLNAGEPIKGSGHNVIDAAGIAKWAAGRARQLRLFAAQRS